MKIKSKICKGTGRAKAFEGCGDSFLVRTYGLCKSCYKNWLLSTEEGKAHIERTTIKVKTDRIKKRKAENQKQRIAIMSNDKYRALYIQPKINEIIRRIDYGHMCIATGNDGKMSAGHYFSSGGHRTLTYHPHNIFIQSFQSNGPKGGDDKNYRLGLIDTFGIEYLEWIEEFRQIPPLNLSRPELEELKTKLAKYKKLVPLIKRSSLQRVLERDVMNLYLGLYDDPYKTFKGKINE